MLAITVVFSLAEADATRFVQRLRQHATNSLSAEPGCQRFDACLDPEQSGRIFFFEVYDDRAAFDQHVATPHYAAF